MDDEGIASTVESDEVCSEEGLCSCSLLGSALSLSDDRRDESNASKVRYEKGEVLSLQMTLT